MLNKTTKNTKDISFKYKEIRDIVEKCLKKNYRVFIFQDKEVSQVFISNGNNQICTVHTSSGGLNVGTVHKHCKSCGTGFCVYNELGIVSMQQVEDACNLVAPSWARRDYESIKKWKSPEEKLNSCSVLNYVEITL